MKRLCLMLIFACLCGAPAFGADLVRNGEASGEFILSPDATRPEVFAVTDVRHWVQEMTGAKVPVLSAPSVNKNTKVFVGTGFASAFKEDLAKLAGNDGYAIREKDGNIYVFGNRPRGTMYGVFALLEKNTDIIWARPNRRFGTVFGQRKDLPLSQVNVLDIPVFWLREFGGGHPYHEATGEWQLHNGNNRGGRGLFEPEWDMIASMGTNLAGPLQGAFKDHPDYFGFDPLKGGRKGVSHGEGTLCLTYPGLPEIWARAVLKQIADNEARYGRKLDAYLIGPGDNWFCCLCDNCIKPIQLPGGGQLAMKDRDPTVDSLFRSTQIFMFLNEAMKTIKKEAPRVRIAVLAYIHMAEPPACEIDPDLLVYYAPYPTNTMHFPLLDSRQAPVWRTRFEAWMKKTPNLGFYEYFYSKPSPLAFYAAENLRALLKTGNPAKTVVYSEFDNDRGASGIGENSLGWDVGAMNTWVIARLFWNPNQDVDGLYRYYIQRTYREAAPQMTEYYELIKKAWIDSGDKSWDGAHAGISGIYNNMIVKQGLEAKVAQLLAQAEEAARHPNSRAMISRMRLQFQSFSKGLNRLMVASVPEMAHDGDSFDSVQWGKTVPMDEFKVIRRQGEILPPSQRTELRAGQDGTNLYLKYTAYDTEIAKATAAAHSDNEKWPAGDHGEIWFDGGGLYAFAFDCNGNTYDSKNYDRSWNSNWRVVTRKTTKGWEAIAVIPLQALSLKPGTEVKLKWTAFREINHGEKKPEFVSFRAAPPFNAFFPIVAD